MERFLAGVVGVSTGETGKTKVVGPLLVHEEEGLFPGPDILLHDGLDLGEVVERHVEYRALQVGLECIVHTNGDCGVGDGGGFHITRLCGDPSLGEL